MHILLINANPVVSRLLVLCTRDDAVVLDDVSVVEDVETYAYDIVFVDESSYGRDVADLLMKLGTAKKVFISYRSDDMRGFDVTIKKPFLPSQITDIIKDIEVLDIKPELKEDVLLIENEESDEEVPHIFPLSSDDEKLEEKIEEIEKLSEPTVLDGDEIEKIKALLEMDENEDIFEEILSEEELEARKVELIKEQLIADGLEIVEEDAIVEELSINLDGTLLKNKQKKSKSKKIKFTEENMERIEDAVEMAMAMMTKKQMKKLLNGKEIEVSIKLQDNN